MSLVSFIPAPDCGYLHINTNTIDSRDKTRSEGAETIMNRVINGEVK